MNLASSAHGCRPRYARLPSKNRKATDTAPQDQPNPALPTTDRARETMDTVHQTPRIRTMPTTRRRRPGSTTAEMQHRASWAPAVNSGTVECDRCHQLIKPGQKWEMGHPIDAPYAAGNHDWTTRRPQHQTCNRSGLVLPEPEPTFGW